VFISHTSELRDYPKGQSYVAAVERAISAAGHVIVDMADFPAAAQPASQVCIERVLGCDVYVGVLGTRYGSLVRDRPEISYTELEFDTATEAGLDRLVFVLDTGAENVGIPLQELIDRQFGDRQDAFRRKVQEGGLVTGPFASPTALGQLVERSLRELAEKRRSAGLHDDDLAARGKGELPRVLPAPVLDVEVRGRGQMIEQLTGLALAPPGQVQVLSGLGGSGKSTIARAVAAWMAAEGRRVWWVSAADPVSAAQLLLGLAGELGESRSQVEEALAGRVNPSDVLWQHLEAVRDWVLVLDNADDPAALKAGDRPAVSGAGWLRSTRAGLVLVTSRVGDPQAWGPVADVLQLEPLDDADGAQVLLDLAPAAGDRAAAQSLAGQLGGLPLALHQAGSYLSSPFAAEATFALYQQALSVRFAELMGRGSEDRAKVIATWELSLEALAAQGKGQARPLLRVLSCLASSVAVPPLLLDREVLARMCGGMAEVEEGLSGLLSVGLISIPQALSTGEAPGVRVHPLVAQTMRYQAGDALAGSLTVAVELLAAAVSHLKYDDPGHAADWLTLVPHLRTLLLSDLQLAAAAETSLAESAVQISAALLWGGSYLASLDLAEAAVGREHGLAEDQEVILRLRRRVASAWQFLGRDRDAEAEYRQVLDARLRLLGPDHPDTLTTRHDLATVLYKQGKLAEAETEARQALDARLRVLGPDAPTTLSTRYEIGRLLAAQGKQAEAETEFRQVLDAELRVLGPDHLSTLATRYEIARLLAAQDMLAEAESGFRQVLDAELRVLGPDHPSTLATRYEIARLLAAQGMLAEAETEFRQVLDANERVLGPDHPHTLATRYEIARLLATQGMRAEAEAELRQVLDASQRALGPDHPNTLITAEALQHLQRRQR